MHIVKEPFVTAGRGLGGKGAMAVVVDDKEHHKRETGDGHQTIAPTGGVLADALPVQVQQAIQPQQVGKREDDAHPQRHLSLYALRAAMRYIIDNDTEHAEGEGDDKR